MKKNDVVILTTDSLALNGSGVARHEGMVVFVPHAAAGDVVTVRIIKAARSYMVGKIEKVLTPSLSRITPDCAAYPRCGGCSFRHISYSAELELKQRAVEDSLQRIGGIDIAVQPILSSQEIYRYRNKAQYPVAPALEGEMVAGFYASGTHRVVPHADCLLQSARFAPIVAYLTTLFARYGINAYDEGSRQGLIRHIYLREGRASGEVALCIVVNHPAPSMPNEEDIVAKVTSAFSEVVSVYISANDRDTNVILGEHSRLVYGKRCIRDELCGRQFNISPESFYQVNPAQTEVLYGLVNQYAMLNEGEVLLDLYCGVGTIGLCVVRDGARLIGVEAVEQAVADAYANAALNGITDARFICADAAEGAELLSREGIKPNVVVIDPPRKGCGEGLIETIAGMEPSRVVYVSCDHATLARDLKAFAELGYVTERVQPVDMFPRTGHVETVVLITQDVVCGKENAK